MTAETLNTTPRAARLIYILDAAVCFALGIALMALAGPLAAITGGVLPPALLFWAGLVLLPWAAFNLYTGRARHPAPGILGVHLLGDAAWVVGSVIVLVAYAGSLNAIGMVLLAGQAVAVLGVFTIKLVTRRALA
jgi:hypothetical protein